MIPEYPKKLSRIASVLFLIGSVIWVQWPIDIERYNIVSGIIFLASLLAWMAIEAADLNNDNRAQKILVNDDVRKFNRVMVMLDRRLYYTVRSCAIETYMPSDAYRGLEDLIAYSDTDIFPFHNKTVQVKYGALIEMSHDFTHKLYSLYTSDGDGRMTWRSRGDGWVSDEVYADVRANVAELNQMATAIADELTEFVRTARDELKGSDIVLEQYDL